jgi:hypothetical protein
MTFQEKINLLCLGESAFETAIGFGVTENQIRSWRTGKSRPRKKEDIQQLEARMFWIFAIKGLLSESRNFPATHLIHASYRAWQDMCYLREKQHFWELHLYASELAWRMAGDKRFGSPEHYIFSCPECGWARDWKSTRGGRVCPVCGHVADKCFITPIRNECRILQRCGDVGYTERRFRFFGLSKDDRDWQLKPYKP